VRRVLLIAALVALLGLTTAVAANVSVEVEDVASFTTDVSITVPATPVPGTIYIRGAASGASGTLDFTAPASNDSVTGKLLVLSTETLQSQTDATKYFTWRSPAAPAGGWLLSGTVSLTGISQNGGGSNRMTAGLFSCAAAAAPDSSNTGQCQQIDLAVGNVGGSGSGFQERTVSFGTVPTTTIPGGHELRLKIVNRAQEPVGTVVSSSSWDLQWGFLPARQSRLVITP
jgi:hypothetical protein